MRCGLPILAAAAVLSASGGPAYAATTATDVKSWDGVGNQTDSEPRAGWNWRSDGDPTAAAPLNGGADGLNESGQAARLPSDVPNLDGAPAEIYTIGGKPLSPAAAAAAAPEPKGPMAFLAKLTPKGVPAPATWILVLVGVAMIGAAVRGLWTANRNLARLRVGDEE